MLPLPTGYTVEEETTLVLYRPIPSQVTLKTSSLLSWCFEPSQPHSVVSGLNPQIIY